MKLENLDGRENGHDGFAVYRAVLAAINPSYAAREEGSFLHTERPGTGPGRREGVSDTRQSTGPQRLLCEARRGFVRAW